MCSPSSTSWPYWLWIVARVVTWPVSPCGARSMILERRGVGVGLGPAGRPEDVADLEILERPRLDDRECRWIELVRAGGG